MSPPIVDKGRTLIKEFHEFALKGNVLDLAVGVIIGGAFSKIVSSVVADVLMPPIGIILGGVNLKDIKITLQEGQVPVTLNIGNFLQASFDFLIIAVAIFFLIRSINTLRRVAFDAGTAATPPPPEPPKPADVALLEEIRDLLRAGR